MPPDSPFRLPGADALQVVPKDRKLTPLAMSSRAPLLELFVTVAKASGIAASILICWCLAFAIAGLSWLIPIDVAQGWAVGRAADDDFARFEAHGAMTATMWSVRVASTLLVLALGIIWIQRRRVAPAVAQAFAGFWQDTRPTLDPESAPSVVSKVQTGVVRVLVVSWLVLGVYQLGCSVNRRLWDWPLYQLHAGQTILPNISDGNREVIRFVASSTPPNARILVLSDQKVYFLSYYLLPRRLYHPSHPDSVFVIAKAHNERQLAAYRLQDLTSEQIDQLSPDYILEYFEGKQFIEGVDLKRDQGWLNYQRRKYGPDWQPSYLVSLRRHVAKDAL